MNVNDTSLNTIPPRAQYPCEYIGDLIDKIPSSKVFIKLDMASGYHVSHIHLDGRPNKMSVTAEGSNECMIIVFNLANALSGYMSTMHHILGLNNRVANVYLNNVMIVSSSLVERKMYVNTILLPIIAVHRQLDEGKFIVGATKISFVGFKVNFCGIDTDDGKITGLNKFCSPLCSAC
jgi:hypothetical protein